MRRLGRPLAHRHAAHPAAADDGDAPRNPQKGPAARSGLSRGRVRKRLPHRCAIRIIPAPLRRHPFSHRDLLLDLATFGIVSAVVATGAALQGSVGFGLGLFSVPLLLLIAPQFVPGPLLASSLSLTLLLAHHERAGIEWRALGWALSGRVVGIAGAAFLLATVSASALGVWSAAFVLLAVLLTASGLHVAPAPRTLMVAGALSGLLGTAVSIGGPPMALLYQQEPGSRLRGTLSAFFLVGVGMSVAGLALAGRFGLGELWLAAHLVPGILVGFGVSRFTAQALDRGYTRPAILVVSALSSVMVLARTLF